jgi:hypothetical protein
MRSPRLDDGYASSAAPDPSACAAGTPTGVSSGRSRIPSCRSDNPSSRSEHNIPCESTPRSFRSAIVNPPISVPGNATTPTGPAVAFGAPHTIVRGRPSPTSTRHTERRSASGCGAHSTILPVTIPSGTDGPAAG